MNLPQLAISQHTEMQLVVLSRYTDKRSPGNVTATTLFDLLESWWRTVLGGLRNVCGEHGRIVIFSTLTEYVRGLEKNEHVSAGDDASVV
jgi:hypothetical protein